MNLIKVVLFLSFSFIYSQVGIQVTQTSNIANGEQTTSLFTTNTTEYQINENLFDINATYKHFNLYTQLEYIDYNGQFNLKLGDIHSIESRGLIFNSYQDQSTDFDNGIKGIRASYGMDWFDLYLIHGSDGYEFRSNPVNQLNDSSYDHTTTFIGTSVYPNDNISLNFQYQNQSISIC